MDVHFTIFFLQIPGFSRSSGPFLVSRVMPKPRPPADSQRNDAPIAQRSAELSWFGGESYEAHILRKLQDKSDRSWFPRKHRKHKHLINRSQHVSHIAFSHYHDHMLLSTICHETQLVVWAPHCGFLRVRKPVDFKVTREKRSQLLWSDSKKGFGTHIYQQPVQSI